MMFDAYDDYQNSKRKERNMQRALPFFLVFLLLALMGWAGYRGYKSVKPKPVAAEPVVIPYTKLSAATISCNDGVMVTDWRYCQEYESPVHAVVEDDAFITISPRRERRSSWANDHACYRYTLDANRNGVNTAIVCPEDEPKHKRKPAFPVPPEDSDIGSGGNYVGEWTFGKFPEHQMTETTKDTQVIWEEKATPTDEVRLLVQPNERVSDAWNHNTVVKFVFTKEQASRLGNEWIKPCGPDNHDNGCWQDSKPETTPADITNLMEQIVPTPTLHRHEPDCKMPADIDVCPAQMLDPKVKP